jgi:hypothetical protein
MAKGLMGGFRGRYGRPGAVGSLIAFISYAMVSVLTAISAPQGGQALLDVRLTAGEGVLIGSVLLGVMTLSARVVPWWCGVLMIVGFPLGDFSDAIVREARGSCWRYSGGQ